MFFPLDPMISPLKSNNLPLEYGVLPLKCTHFAIQIPYFYLETRDFCFEPHHVSPEIAQSSLAILPFHLGNAILFTRLHSVHYMSCLSSHFHSLRSFRSLRAFFPMLPPSHLIRWTPSGECKPISLKKGNSEIPKTETQNLKYENLKIQKMKNWKLQKLKSQKLKPLKNYDAKTRKLISHAVLRVSPCR